MKKLSILIVLLFLTPLLFSQGNPATFSKVTSPIYKINNSTVAPSNYPPTVPSSQGWMYSLYNHLYWGTFRIDSVYASAVDTTGWTMAQKAWVTSNFEPKIGLGTTAQYWRGDKTWQAIPLVDLTPYAKYDSLPFINVKREGAKGDSTTNDLAAINAALRLSINTIYFPAGDYKVTSTISVPSNKRLIFDPMARIFLANSSDTLLIANEHFAAGDSNIIIEGGIFDGNGLNQADKVGIGIDSMQWHGTLMMFQNVKGLKIKSLLIKDPQWFGIHIGKVTDFTIEDISFDYRLKGGDCLHISGLCKNGFVHNLRDPYGKHGDTFVAIMSTDAPQFNITPGEISNIIVDGVITETPVPDYQTLGKMFRGAGVDFLDIGAGIHDISVSNLIGRGQYAGMQFMNAKLFSSAWHKSNIYNIILDKINMTVPGDSSMGSIVFAIDVKNVTISNMQWRPYGRTTTPMIQVYNGVLIDNLTFSNVSIVDSTDHGVTAAIYVSDSAEIKNLTINNWEQKIVGKDTALHLLRMDNKAWVGNIIANNLLIEGGDVDGTFALYNNSYTDNLQISNSTFKNVTNIISVTPQVVSEAKVGNIGLSNVYYTPHSGTTEVIKLLYTLLDTVHVKTSGLNITSHLGTVIGKYSTDIKLRLNSLDFAINADSTLSPRRHDVVINSNPYNPTGLSEYDGSKWVGMVASGNDTLRSPVIIEGQIVPRDSTIAMADSNGLFKFFPVNNPPVGFVAGINQHYEPYLQGITNATTAKPLLIQPFGGIVKIGAIDTTLNATLQVEGDQFVSGEASLGSAKITSVPLLGAAPTYGVGLGIANQLSKYNWPDPTNGNTAYSWGNHSGLYVPYQYTGGGQIPYSRLDEGVVTPDIIGSPGPNTFLGSLNGGTTDAVPQWQTINQSQWTTSGTSIYYSGGNVGIGVTNPVKDFQVGATAMVVDVANGRVGIGTTAPGVALDVIGTIRSSGNVQSSNGVGVFNNTGILTAYAGVFVIQNTSTNAASAMSFKTKDTEAMRIDPSQKVGIGTTAPLVKLHVAGAIMMDGTDTTGVGSTAKVGTMQYYNGHFYGLKAGTPPVWTQIDN